jgi:hypothetical protein
MYDAFGLDWTGLFFLIDDCTAQQAEQQTINQSYKALPESRGFNKESKAKQVSKRTRVHVCVLRSSTFLVCTEYLHEMKRKNERKNEEQEEQASKQERKKECQFLLRCHQKKRKKARVS